MDIINKQCHKFNLCSNWEKVKRNSNIMIPQNIASKALAPNDGVSGPVADTHQTVSRVHNTTRRGNYYIRDIPTQQASHHSNTASSGAPSHPRAAPVPSFPSHLATTMPTIRG
ncbi:hypothetical protein Pcinc_016284 [Petrolisthes cinctipes]|uniref:Uncharacterized protein n=1 Tax=Petrolisthes cinctipes TaxID=88211 RepID=A0AAE1FT58_PETCI|nr:hypothetical protein Pcinc_016284 [Petrolisthes cinctipes]